MRVLASGSSPLWAEIQLSKTSQLVCERAESSSATASAPMILLSLTSPDEGILGTATAPAHPPMHFF